MDLEDLKDDMLALRSEAEALPAAVERTLAHIGQLLLEAERVANEFNGTAQAARGDLNELGAALASWQTQAQVWRDEVVSAMQALDAALDEQLPVLETARQDLAGALRDAGQAAAALEGDIKAAASTVEDARSHAVSALDDLGGAALHSEEELRQGVEAARHEGEQLGDGAESGKSELVADLDELKTTVETLARQAEATVADIGSALTQDVDTLTVTVTEAVDVLATAHGAFLEKLEGGVTVRVEAWRNATKEAVAASDELVKDVDHAREQIHESTGTAAASFGVLSGFDGSLGTVIDQVKDAALTAGLEWL